MEYWLKSYIDTRALPLYFDICILLAVDTASRDIFIAWFENNIKYLRNIIFSDVLLVFRKSISADIIGYPFVRQNVSLQGKNISPYSHENISGKMFEISEVTCASSVMELCTALSSLQASSLAVAVLIVEAVIVLILPDLNKFLSVLILNGSIPDKVKN